MNISIVIPSYNRGSKLRATIEPLLNSTIDGLEEVEIIVVDDGSPDPLAPIVSQCTPAPPFLLRCIRQDNAGPAAARNRGFAESRGEIVLFIDDDIICPPDLIIQHIEAHRKRPQAVICGRCELIPPEPVTPLFRFVESLGNNPGKGANDEFLEVDVVASGQLSIERSLFAAAGTVYRSDLATPAAEEYELSCRLRQLGVPILIATRITALHDHPVALDSMCRQIFKHAKGCAEAAIKIPALTSFSPVAQMISCNRTSNSSGRADTFKRRVKALVSTPIARRSLMRTARACEMLAPVDVLLAPVYRVLFGAHTFAGINQAFKEYSSLN